MAYKHLKWILWIVTAAAASLAILSIAISFVLPGYVEHKLVPDLSRQFGLTPEQVEVRRIGWWGADIGPIRISASNNRAVTIAAIQIDYSPFTLLRKEIAGITLVGLSLELSVAPAEVTAIAEHQPPLTAAPADEDDKEFNLSTLLPIRLGRISIIQSRAVIDFHNRRHLIPFELDLQTTQLKKGRLKGNARMSILGNPLTLEASIDQTVNRAELTFEANDFRLESIPKIGNIQAQLSAEGKTDLSGIGTFKLQPFQLTRLSISGQFRDTRIATPQMVLHNLGSEGTASQPIVVSVSGENLSNIKWRCTPFQVSGLLYLIVKGIEGDSAFSEQGWSLKAAVETLIPKQKIPQGAQIETDLAMNWQAAAHRGTDDSNVEFDLQGQGRKPLQISFDNRKLTGEFPNITLDGRLQGDILSAKGMITSKNTRIQLPNGEMIAPSFSLINTIHLQQPVSESPSSMTSRAVVPGARFTYGTASMHVKQIILDAAGQKISNQPWHFDGSFKLINGRILDPPNSVKMSRLAIDLPLRWPNPTAIKSGRVELGAFEWQKHQMGGFKGQVQQVPLGLTMSFHHTSKLFPGLRVLINGDIDNNGARIEAEIPPHHLGKNIDLGLITPTAAGILVSGQLRATGALTADRRGARGSGTFKFNQGQVRQDERGLLIDDIDVAVQIDDIFHMKSAPHQNLRVGSLTFGSLKADALDIDFQIEDQKRLFIEKASVDWSQGKINVAPIKVNANKNDYDVTLFCDRLNLAMVLEQLGATKATGDGTVSGRIPISWTDGRLTFDNGFLFSTPGQTGSIKVSEMQTLLAGLPPGTPQHTQLDIATEALKDYSYNWAKLNLQSEDEILLLKLQFDGKPNQLLPFGYDQSLGQLKRIAGKGQAKFKGIGIDLNLRSPLNEIIKYKGLLKQK